jgi:hypothetical protein
MPVREIEIIEEEAEEKGERTQPQKRLVVLVAVVEEQTESRSDDNQEDGPVNGHSMDHGEIFEGEKNSDEDQNNSNEE